MWYNIDLYWWFGEHEAYPNWGTAWSQLTRRLFPAPTETWLSPVACHQLSGSSCTPVNRGADCVASVTLKSKTLNRGFGHKSWTLRRTLPLTIECLRIWWEAFIIDTCWWSERDVFSTASWVLDNTEKTSKEAQLIHLFLANCYLDMHQRGGLGSQETQKIKKSCDGLEARLHLK